MSDKYDELKEKLKNRGYKLTPQRKSIFDVIIDNIGKHLSTEDIYDIVRKKCSDIGLATVYRALILFDEIDVVSKLILDDSCVRYEINSHREGHYHHHLICNNCGKVIEVNGDYLEELEHKIETEYDFKIVDHKLKFFGICSNCKKAL
ncbi:Fur family transcriptional regulator [Helicovermis profundi]|uniref:Fur family transcriptional regulator n=1 Tax=Helicovermis profundi TaxID=3065157 RepID=A0AAU9EHJ4_9FIRM|nr:Fur family transcriptional regulator [Clostridia bacterium S502]